MNNQRPNTINISAIKIATTMAATKSRTHL